MATDPRTVASLLDQLAGAGDVSARKMFGEYAVYRDGKMVGSVCDDQLFVKPTVAGRAYIGAAVEAPPYAGAKPHFLIDGALWDDGAWLSRLIVLTADALPAPKPKQPKSPPS